MLNKEMKDKWVAALRSGKYKKGAQYLRFKDPDDNQDRFCCLGVLCDIQNRKWKPDVYSPSRYTIGEGSAEDHTGDKNKKLHRDVGGFSIVQKLMLFNDTGKSFKWIARWIEGNLKCED